MGNNLSGIAAAQIFPVEHYLADLNNDQDALELGLVTFDSSLGSTRFLKAAKARSDAAGTVVLKVFTVQDSSLDLKSHQLNLIRIKKLLENCPNCLPFQRAHLNDRAGFMVSYLTLLSFIP